MDGQAKAEILSHDVDQLFTHHLRHSNNKSSHIDLSLLL